METFNQSHHNHHYQYNYPYLNNHHHHDYDHHEIEDYYNTNYNYGYNNDTYNNYDNLYYHQPADQEDSPAISPVPVHETVLALPNVLHKILSYVPIPDLKLKRPVCKQWEEEICKILRGQQNVIVFHTYREMMLYAKSVDGHRDMYSSFCFGPKISMDGCFIQEWMTTFAPHIRSLEMQTCSVHGNSLGQILRHLHNLERLIMTSTILGDKIDDKEAINQQLPKLKYLEFLDYTNINQDNNNEKRLFNEILRIAPNLAQVKIKRPPSFSSADLIFKNTLEISDLTISTSNDTLHESSPLEISIWSTLLQSEFAQKLTKLDLNVKLTNNCVQSLTVKKFPLKSLDLKILPEVSNKILHDLLSSLKETLIQLKIMYCGNGRLAYETDLPLTEPLPHVKTVHLEQYQGSLWFVEKIPNLLQLSFARTNLNKVVLKDNADCPPQRPEGVHLSLRSFKVYQDFANNVGPNRQRSIQTVQKLGMQFPLLRRLRLEKLVDESLCLIYAQWPNLEELEIVHGQFSDAGIVSIHPNAYKVILREEAYDNYNVDALRQGLFLGNLSKLTRLKIHSPNITDVTMILGVLPCPNIRDVCVQSFKITDTSLYRMLNKPTILHLSTKNCNQLTPDAINYAEKILTARGGTSSLNKVKGSLDINKTVKFLERNPILKVLLKRLSTKTIIKPSKPASSKFKSSHKTKIAKLVPQKPVHRIRRTRFNVQQKVQKQDVIATAVVEEVMIAATPSPPTPSTTDSTEKNLSLIIKSARPTRNTGSIFRRFKDFALF